MADEKRVTTCTCIEENDALVAESAVTRCPKHGSTAVWLCEDCGVSAPPCGPKCATALVAVVPASKLTEARSSLAQALDALKRIATAHAPAEHLQDVARQAIAEIEE